MKIKLLGLSLQMRTLQPILIIQAIQTNELYSLPIPLEDATFLANYFHFKQKHILLSHSEILKHIRMCHKNIEQASFVFSPEGILITQMQIKSWFRRRYVQYPLIVGISISLYYHIDIHASHKLLKQIQKTTQIELQRITDAALYSLETSMLYDTLITEKTLLGMHPEPMFIM